jgi:hypothetical protein
MGDALREQDSPDALLRVLHVVDGPLLEVHVELPVPPFAHISE